MCIPLLYVDVIMSEQQIYTPQQKDRVRQGLEQIDNICYNTNAPEGFMKTREGGIIGYTDETDEYEIVVRSDTGEDCDACLMRYATVKLTVELYHRHTMLESVTIIGSDEYKNEPRMISFWGQALGFLSNIHNYEDSVQQVVEDMGRRVRG